MRLDKLYFLITLKLSFWCHQSKYLLDNYFNKDSEVETQTSHLNITCRMGQSSEMCGLIPILILITAYIYDTKHLKDINTQISISQINISEDVSNVRLGCRIDRIQRERDSSSLYLSSSKPLWWLITPLHDPWASFSLWLMINFSINNPLTSRGAVIAL